MRRMMASLMILAMLPVCGVAQQQRDSSKILPDGTAYVTRVVPVPKTVSPEAQALLARVVSDSNVPTTLEQRRAGTDKWQAGAGEVSKRLYPVNVTESIPLANLTGTKVVAVLYRLAPEHPYPAAVDDAIAVYKEMLKTYKPKNIGIYGTSAGAILTAEVTAKIKQLHLPMPGATGVFSGMGDFSRAGDSTAMYALNGLSGYLAPPRQGNRDYSGSTDLKDPVLSPVYGNLAGFPPTLFITSGRDLLLSGTTILHRAYLRAGVDAQLVVFEALPHAFWNNPELPESKEADALMAKFFDTQLGK